MWKDSLCGLWGIICESTVDVHTLHHQLFEHFLQPLQYRNRHLISNFFLPGFLTLTKQLVCNTQHAQKINTQNTYCTYTHTCTHKCGNDLYLKIDFLNHKIAVLHQWTKEISKQNARHYTVETGQRFGSICSMQLALILKYDTFLYRENNLKTHFRDSMNIFFLPIFLLVLPWNIVTHDIFTSTWEVKGDY